MGLVDWNAIWNAEILLSRRARLNSGRFWDEIADRDQGTEHLPDDLTALQLQRIAAISDDTVLEIGPGLGRLTLPLARSARAVTALDSSARMLERLRERAGAAGLANLRTVHGAWEDADALAGVAPQAVVVASYSLFMLDMRTQLERMQRFATDRVCLFVPAAPRMPEAVERILYGTVVTSRIPDHALLFNLLHDLGIDADVEVLRTLRRKTYTSRQAVVEERVRFYDAPEAKRGEIAAYVDAHLQTLGEGVALTQTVETGVLCWRVA